MIVSHQHKFIFIKNRKVAGSSIEVALAPVCGPDDIITPDPNQRPVARNFNPPHPIARELLGTLNPLQHARSLRDYYSIRPTFFTHVAAYEARARLGRQVWDGYYKFCFDRNPWDKFLSFYYWYFRKHETPPMSFEDFVLQRRLVNDRVCPSDWRRYALGGKVVAQFIGRYENLTDDFQKVCDHLGIEARLEKREKTDTRPADTRNYREHYTDRMRDRVAYLFRREIDLLGYEF